MFLQLKRLGAVLCIRWPAAYELLDFCQCICGCEAMPIGMQARAIVTELNGIRHVRGSSLFAWVDLRHALHHAAREVHWAEVHRMHFNDVMRVAS